MNQSADMVKYSGPGHGQTETLVVRPAESTEAEKNGNGQIISQESVAPEADPGLSLILLRALGAWQD
jgi:hypothetical protein